MGNGNIELDIQIKVETVSASSEQNPHSIEEKYLFEYVLKGPFRPLCIH